MINKFVSLKKELGLIDAVLYLCSKCLDSIPIIRMKLIKYYLVAQPISARALLSSNRAKNIDVRELGYDEDVLYTFPRPRAVIDFRKSLGARCFGAFKNGEFIGGLWFIKEKYEEDEVKCHYFPKPIDKVVWDFDVYITPLDRMGFSFLKLWDYFNERMNAEAVDVTMSRISAFNLASRTSHRRLGANDIGWQVFVVIGTFQLLFSSLTPYFHFSWSGKAVPKVVIHYNS